MTEWDSSSQCIPPLNTWEMMWGGLSMCYKTTRDSLTRNHLPQNIPKRWITLRQSFKLFKSSNNRTNLTKLSTWIAAGQQVIEKGQLFQFLDSRVFPAGKSSWETYSILVQRRSFDKLMTFLPSRVCCILVQAKRDMMLFQTFIENCFCYTF